MKIFIRHVFTLLLALTSLLSGETLSLEEEINALKLAISHLQEQLSIQADQVKGLDNTKTDSPKGESDQADNPETTIYDEGFWFKTGHYKLRIGGLVEIDGRFFTHANEGKSTFLVRRARLFATGTLMDMFNYMIMGSWDRQNPPRLFYAWIETARFDLLRLRAGLFKEPFSLEILYSDVYWEFTEFSLARRNYLHVREVGVMAFGKTKYDTLEYGIGLFNGRGPEHLDNNNNKEVIGRLVLKPFLNGAFERLYIGFSGASGRQKENLSGKTFKTPEEVDFWFWEGSAKNPTKVNANRLRWGCDLEWLYGSSVIRTEYFYTDWGSIRNKQVSKRFTGSNWYIMGAYILTGEKKPRNKAIVPFHNFDMCGNWGAFEIAGRYEIFTASKNMLKAHLAKGANKVDGFTLAFNWYMNRFVAMKFDWRRLYFNRTVRSHKHKIDGESVLTARIQAEF
jgi:phosphate-selective porin OprO and OprP